MMAEATEIVFDKQEFSYYLYDGQEQYEKYMKIKILKDKYKSLEFRPANYTYDSLEHIKEESNQIMEMIKLHNEKKIDLYDVKYLSELTQYSRIFEVHGLLFKSIASLFLSDQNLSILYDRNNKYQLIGSILLEELDYNTNNVTDYIETIAEWDPNTKQFVINTAIDRPKFCRYFNGLSTHVIVITKFKLDGKIIGQHPFLIRLYDPQTGQLFSGITMKWLGSSIGYRQSREYSLSFKDVRIDANKHLLSKFLAWDSSKNTILYSQPETWDFFIKVCKLAQQSFDIYKSAKEALKAIYLAIKWTNQRTQFKTLNEKGKERPIFEYQFNKIRILKGLVQALTIFIASQRLRENIMYNMQKPLKNQDRLNEFSLIINAYEVYSNEKCTEIIETMREACGGMGYLKYSGIPNLLENAIKNSVYTSRFKQQHYIALASHFILQDPKKKSDFFRYFLPFLSEIKSSTISNSGRDVVDSFKRADLLCWIEAQKVIWRKDLIIKDGLMNKEKELVGRNLEEPLKLAIDLIENINVTIYYHDIAKRGLKPSSQLINVLAIITAINNLQADARFLLDRKDMFKKGFVQEMDTTLMWAYDCVSNIRMDLIDSFLFDEKMLQSCFRKTIDETYLEVYAWAKNHNPRNDPKLHEEIRKDILAYMNRPADPKL